MRLTLSGSTAQKRLVVARVLATPDRENASSWARPFTARLLEPGLVSYEDRGCGIALLRKETIDRDIHSFVGRPLVIRHQKTSPANMKVVGHGYIASVFYNEADGWWYGRGLCDTDEAAKEINLRGFSSVGYKVTKNGTGGKWHDMTFHEEILGFTGEHLAIEPRPRYEDATIRLNSKNQPTTKMKFTWFRKRAAAPAAGAPSATEVAAAEQKRLADEAAARENAKGDEIDGETIFEIAGADGKPEKVSLSALVEAHNAKANGSEVDGEDEITCNGKNYKVNALIQAFDKWTTHNALEEEKKTKENALAAEAEKTRLAEEAATRENAGGAKRPDFFRVIERAPLTAPVSTGPISTNSQAERLERGAAMFGSPKK